MTFHATVIEMLDGHNFREGRFILVHSFRAVSVHHSGEDVTGAFWSMVSGGYQFIEGGYA